MVWAHTGGIWMVTQVHLNWRACVSICSCVRVWLSGLSCTGWESIQWKILCLSYTLFISKLQKLRRKKPHWGFSLWLSWTHLSHVPKLLTKLETERTSSSFKSHYSSIPLLQKNSWSRSGSAIDQLPPRSLTSQVRNVHVGIVKSRKKKFEHPLLATEGLPQSGITRMQHRYEINALLKQIS